MPFAVFRRHSKKLLAVFAILSMIGFVLSDSLPALLRAQAPFFDHPHLGFRAAIRPRAQLYGTTARRGAAATCSEGGA